MNRKINWFDIRPDDEETAEETGDEGQEKPAADCS